VANHSANVYNFEKNFRTQSWVFCERAQREGKLYIMRFIFSYKINYLYVLMLIELSLVLSNLCARVAQGNKGKKAIWKKQYERIILK
jgi:hypothetical protein